MFKNALCLSGPTAFHVCLVSSKPRHNNLVILQGQNTTTSILPTPASEGTSSKPSQITSTASRSRCSPTSCTSCSSTCWVGGRNRGCFLFVVTENKEGVLRPLTYLLVHHGDGGGSVGPKRSPTVAANSETGRC